MKIKKIELLKKFIGEGQKLLGKSDCNLENFEHCLKRKKEIIILAYSEAHTDNNFSIGYNLIENKISIEIGYSNYELNKKRIDLINSVFKLVSKYNRLLQK